MTDYRERRGQSDKGYIGAGGTMTDYRERRGHIVIRRQI